LPTTVDFQSTTPEPLGFQPRVVQFLTKGRKLVTSPCLQQLNFAERKILLWTMLAETSSPLGAVLNAMPPPIDGLIFCRNCGAVLRPPLPLTRPVRMDDAPSNTIRLAKRILIVVLKGIAGIAAIIAIFCPLGSFTQIFLFAASAAVALICYVALTNLDATHIEEYGEDGYWPKPLDWSPPSKTCTSAENGTPRTKT
jgi:hypothetical protein